ncbi:hypothetical protein ACHAPC_011137 [Botrytis cinerea]
MPSLIQHRRSMKHCSCLCCDPLDSQEELREARQPSIDKYTCPQCKQRFAQKPSLEAHQRENLHAYCYKCDIISSTRFLNALHMQSHSSVRVTTLSSATPFWCCDCERNFKSERALTAHLRYSQVHTLQKGAEKENLQEQQDEGDRQAKCKKCPKTFKDCAALKQHLMSVHRKPLGDINFMANVERKKQFSFPSAQLHHLEAVECVSGMTKTKLNAAIAVNNSEAVKIQGPLERNTSETSASQIRSSKPTSTSFDSTITKLYSMLAIFWPQDSHGYQTCPRCPRSSTRRFKHDALQQHLSSSVHN